jgi:hypothetical protein
VDGYDIRTTNDVPGPTLVPEIIPESINRHRFRMDAFIRGLSADRADTKIAI